MSVNDYNLDQTDRTILNLLIKDARTQYSKIAKECHMTSAGIYKRIRNLKKAIKQLVRQRERLLEAYLAEVVQLPEFERKQQELKNRFKEYCVYYFGFYWFTNEPGNHYHPH